MDDVNITVECRVLLRSPEEVAAAKAREDENIKSEKKEPD